MNFTLQETQDLEDAIWFTVTAKLEQGGQGQAYAIRLLRIRTKLAQSRKVFREEMEELLPWPINLPESQ